MLAQVLAGGGGVGKTQLAAAYTHQSLADGVELVVWVDASEVEHVVARYAHAARCVQAPETLLEQGAEADARAFLQWLATTGRSWLVVLDDVTDPEAMETWWPPPSVYGRGQVLATTRRKDALLSGSGRAVVDVDTYGAEEACAYLRERLTAAHAEYLLDTQADALARALGCLPLAMSHAAAYMINEDVACADYLHRFNHSTARLEELLPRHADTEGYGRQVAAALLLSLEVVQACEPIGLATPALRVAALLDPAGHPQSLWSGDAVLSYLGAHREDPSPADASAQVSPSQARAARRLLHRYGLLTDHAQAGSRAVRLHALTARAVREATPDDVLPDVVKAASEALTEWGKEIPHNEEWAVFRSNVDSLDRCAGDTLWEVGGHHLLRAAGRNWYAFPTAGFAYWERLTAASERLLGREHPETLRVRRDLAVSYFCADRDQDACAVLRMDFGRYEQLACGRPAAAKGSENRVDAVALLEDTLAVRERILGPEDPATIGCQVKLAFAYRLRGKASRATALLERAVTRRQAVLGIHHPSTISVASHLQTWRNEDRKRWWSSWRTSPSGLPIRR
ncbi:tetratricopeptide repeat protein [Streptomyces sp. NRRL S-1868]|uniref:tetratricopeptide repeat protein n=1 Tax=Streptomyces sp. NRRL S-1868 TaxID=1463892 RepID=UPI00131D807E|nr:tetratricopeptide repeat protein [Streptomyces sp. NRRL S-1868]